MKKWDSFFHDGQKLEFSQLENSFSQDIRQARIITFLATICHFFLSTICGFIKKCKHVTSPMKWSMSETTSASNWKVIRDAYEMLGKGHFHFAFMALKGLRL